MNTTTLPEAGATLGDFLRDRRARIQPERPTQRRRTPGLRREEVATRAGVSVTWYTWLEQGRGGAASVALLERLACALELDAAGRAVLAPYDDATPEDRNTLRRLFSDPRMKAALPDWEAQASFAIATFRI